MSYIESIKENTPEAYKIEYKLKGAVSLFLILDYNKLKEFGGKIPTVILDIIFKNDIIDFTPKQISYFYFKISNLIKNLCFIEKSITKILANTILGYHEPHVQGYKENIFNLFERMTEDCGIIGSEARYLFYELYGWNIPSKEVFDKIDELFPKNLQILEVCSGLGLTSAILKMYGFNVISTDNYELYFDKNKHFVDIENIDAVNAVQKYTNREILVMSWPSNDKSFAYDSLLSFRGNFLIYFGEYRGCCANDDFFDLLEKEWCVIFSSNIPNWNFSYSRVIIFERKEIKVETQIESTSVIPNNFNIDNVITNILDNLENQKKWYSHEELVIFSKKLLEFFQIKLNEEVVNIQSGKKINILNWINELGDIDDTNAFDIYKILSTNKKICFFEKIEVLVKNNNIKIKIYHWKKLILHSEHEKLY